MTNDTRIEDQTNQFWNLTEQNQPESSITDLPIAEQLSEPDKQASPLFYWHADTEPEEGTVLALNIPAELPSDGTEAEPAEKDSEMPDPASNETFSSPSLSERLFGTISENFETTGNDAPSATPLVDEELAMEPPLQMETELPKQAPDKGAPDDCIVYEPDRAPRGYAAYHAEGSGGMDVHINTIEITIHKQKPYLNVRFRLKGFSS